uniref:Integrase, catalytic region, zinc finger, CCHC-type, peptidase aspartic, catalytic n=1 Tax=Tanacetum cinerariifolium TaxID=118510 RepID=A0A6L2NE30_TANCI|nr:hypothetical protein [Tanacetum cinerariifolium]
MLNKENYVPRSSRLLWYAKSRPNGKLIYNSIINGPYVRRMIPEPGDLNREVPVNETFHVQTDDELTERELKQIEADDQAIQTILLGLPEDIYAAIDSCETAQEIWLRVQQMMKGSDIRIQEKKAKLFNKWERFTSTEGGSIESYYHQWSRHVTIVHQTKDLHTTDYTQLYDFLKYNQKEVDDLKAERLARTQDPLALMETSNNPYTFLVLYQDQPSFNQNYMQQPMPNPEDITDLTTVMNMALALIAKAFKLNYSTPTNNNQRVSSNPRNRQIAQSGMNMGQDRQMQMNVRNQVIQYAVLNPRIQNIGNQNGLIGVSRNVNQNPNGNGNLVAARAEADLDENEEVNANCILMENLQQSSTLGTQTDKAPVYESDGSTEVYNYENCYDNDIFNMFTQEEQYTELLEPIPEPYQVPQNDNNVIFNVSRVEKSRGTVEQHPANVEETRVLYDSLYNILAIEVDKVNTVNRKLGETNVELTTELARFKNQEKCFEISQEKYDKLERCYQKSVYQEQCLSKKINALHLSSDTHNWSSSAHQELHKIIKDDIFPIVNQVDARMQNFEIQFLKEAAKFVGDFKYLVKEADESLAKHKTLELEIERLLRAIVSYDIMFVVQNNTVVDTSDLQTELERNLPKVDETHALSKPVTLNSTPTPQGSNSVKNDKVIAPGMFRISPFQTFREEKHVPNKVRASVRTNPITVSQHLVITKRVVNSDSNGLSSIGVDNTKTRRPQLRSNTKNDRVLSTSKSSRSKNKEVKNVKVVCVMCKQCLKSVNHDVCLLNYVNGMTSCGKKQTANVSINEKQKKQQPKVKKTKKVGSIERLALPKPSKPRSFLRWSPTGRLFDLKGKLIASSESKSQSDCSNGDNACTSNPLEPKIKRFPNSTSFLGRLSKYVYGTVRFRNDHVTTILGFGDLQWGNILIARVYFVEGLGHKLFSIRQFCDSDLERLHLLHMDLYGPMRIVSINGKRHVLVIMDDYSRYTWRVPYELINGKKPDISFLYVFGALCYPKNDRDDFGKLGAKAMAFDQRNSKPRLQIMTSGQISSGLDITYAPSTITTQQPTEGELDLLFEAMFDDYIGGQPSTASRTVPAVQAHQVRQTLTTSTSIADTAPTPINSSSQATKFPNPSQDVDELKSQQQHAQQPGNQA